MDIDSILAAIASLTDPGQVIALGDLLGVLTGLIRGDLSVLSTAEGSSAFTNPDAWNVLGTVLGSSDS